MASALEVDREIDAAPSEAWNLMVDTARWPAWGPSIREVESSDRLVRAGSRGRVRTFLGFWLPFEITSFEDGRSWSWRVLGVPATGHRVEAVGPGRCRVVFEVPWPAAPYGLVCRWALRRIARLLEGQPRGHPRHAKP